MQVPKPASTKAGKTKEEIIAAIQEAAGRLGRVPTSREFGPLSGISVWQVTGLFGTYGNAVRAAGLELSHRGMKIETAALLEDWGRVVRKVGTVPTRRQYNEIGRYSPDCYADRFESWVRISAEFTRFVSGDNAGGFCSRAGAFRFSDGYRRMLCPTPAAGPANAWPSDTTLRVGV